MLGCSTATVAFLGFTCLLQTQRDAGANLCQLCYQESLLPRSLVWHALSPSLHAEFLKMHCHVLCEL